MCGTLFRSAVMKDWPIRPTPGGSSRPRAKSTSASGQAAEATGSGVVEKGITAGALSKPPETNAATAKRARRDRMSKR